MSQADELLENLVGEQSTLNISSLEDKPHIVVGEDRFITVPPELRRIAVEHDHNVETVTFDCPRYWNGLDMSTMKIFVNYMRSDEQTGSYIADNIAVDSVNTSIMHFNWTITEYASYVQGPLRFLVCIKKADGEGSNLNHWNSELNEEMYVSEGLEVDVTSEEPYPDLITQILTRLDVIEDAAECAVDDVQIDGTSIVGEDGVAIIPIADKNEKLGAVKMNSTYGISAFANGYIGIEPITSQEINSRKNYKAIAAKNLDYAVQAAMGAPIGDGMIDGVFHYPAWSEETQKAAIERIGLKDYAKYKYFNFHEAGVNVEGNPTYDEIKEAILSDVTPVLIHGHYIAHMTSGHWDSEGLEREELPGFTFVTQRSDMNNHWKIKCTEFWCTKQDDGSTLWAVGTHYLDAFIAEYNVTPAEAVIDAYEKGLEIIVKRSEMPDQPAHYARLVRADGYGVTPNLTFTCEENKLSHHYHINGDGWHYWCYNLEDDLNGLNSKISGLQNSVGSIGNILKSVYSFRGGFCNKAGTLHIKNPGIYLVIAGGTGNKTITINYPTGKEFEATKLSGIILLAYEGGVVTPIGIKSSLAFIDAFQLPGTFQGWTSDGQYSTTISYPSMCVVSYLGNSNVDYLS